MQVTLTLIDTATTDSDSGLSDAPSWASLTAVDPDEEIR